WADTPTGSPHYRNIRVEDRFGVGSRTGLCLGSVAGFFGGAGRGIVGGDGGFEAFFLGVRAFKLGATDDRGISDGRGDEPQGADGVVIRRERVGDRAWVAVGIDHRDRRDAETGGFVNGEVLALWV